MPAPGPSACTTTTPPAAGGRSEAFILACVVAEICGPNGSIRYQPEDRVRALVAEHLGAHPHAHLIEWVRRFPLAEHPWRWDCAREVVADLYPDLLPKGVTLPDVYAAYDSIPLAVAS